MYQLTGPGVTMAILVIAAILIFALAFSFRETIRGLVEFFDIRAIRRFLRRSRIASIIIASLTALSLCLWLFVWVVWDSGNLIVGAVVFLAFVPLVLLPSLAFLWTLISDIYQDLRFRRRSLRRQLERRSEVHVQLPEHTSENPPPKNPKPKIRFPKKKRQITAMKR